MKSHHVSSEDAGGTLRFRSVSHLLTVENDTRLLKIVTSVSCLMIIADVSTNTELSQLIDVVTKFKVSKKHLIVTIPQLNVVSLQNKTINFNVVIYDHKQTGRNTSLLTS